MGLWLAMVLAVAPGVHAQFRERGAPVGKDGVITRANLDADEVWPLTIDRATFVCEGDGVFLAAGGVQYPLNGVAKTLAATHPAHRKPLEDIWRRDERAMRGMEDAPIKLDVVRVDITPVLSRGIAWCHGR
jgi:hypothetical protein